MRFDFIINGSASMDHDANPESIRETAQAALNQVANQNGVVLLELDVEIIEGEEEAPQPVQVSTAVGGTVEQKLDALIQMAEGYFGRRISA